MDARSTFLGRRLIEEIEKRRGEYLRPLILGQASDYPDYKARAAYIKALSDIERIIESIGEEEDRRLHGAFGANADRSRSRSETADHQ